MMPCDYPNAAGALRRPLSARGLVTLLVGFAALLCLLPSAANAALVSRTFCIFDPVGQNGPIFHELEAYTTAALQWGVRLHAKAYSDEAVAAADFNAGKCDAVGFTGIRNMHFVKFAGSLDMVGGLQTYAEEVTAIRVMSSPKAAKYMSQGNVEVAGVVPGGKVFLYARNRNNLSSLAKAAGKRVAILDADKQATAFATVAGASPVNATIASFGPMFNNGSVDYAYAPAFAYKALELYKGLGKKGGIADFPLGMLSLQMDIHKNRFPAGYGQKSRDWAVKELLPKALKLEKSFDKAIPAKYWVHISHQRIKKYRALLVQVRQRLWDDGWYNHKMQRLLKKIRCKTNPSAAECSQKNEGGPV